MNKKYTKYLVLSASAFVMIALVIFANVNKQKDSAKEIADSQEITNTTLNSESTKDTLMMVEEKASIDEDTLLEIENLMVNYYDTSKKVDEDLIESDSEKENGQTIKEINEKREGIESYKNVRTFVRPGLEDNTYVVYTAYDMKLYNIKTLAPGMSVLYVAKDESGTFAILDMPDNDQLNEYIDQLTKDEEIAELILDVNTRLSDAIENDKSLKTFVESIEDIAKKEKKNNQ